MIMDPGINGLETYHRILQFNPKQRVIIASGFSRSDLIRKAIAMGARSYLKKPYRIEAIAKAVAEALA
jgi:DNA-binding NarL/FixJ family response regulator